MYHIQSMLRLINHTRYAHVRLPIAYGQLCASGIGYVAERVCLWCTYDKVAVRTCIILARLDRACAITAGFQCLQRAYTATLLCMSHVYLLQGHC